MASKFNDLKIHQASFCATWPWNFHLALALKSSLPSTPRFPINATPKYENLFPRTITKKIFFLAVHSQLVAQKNQLTLDVRQEWITFRERKVLINLAKYEVSWSDFICNSKCNLRCKGTELLWSQLVQWQPAHRVSTLGRKNSSWMLSHSELNIESSQQLFANSCPVDRHLVRLSKEQKQTVLNTHNFFRWLLAAQTKHKKIES